MKTRNILSSILFLKLSFLISGLAHAGFPQDFDDVVWLHTDVSSWPQTSTLRSVSTTSGSITLNYDKTNSWPAKAVSGVAVNANPWIFVKRGGTWYAATWEWMRPGQITKNKASVKGDHIKVAPLNTFVPRQGEIYGFMVSGLARTGSLRNVRERTNVILLRWDNEMIPYCTRPPLITRFQTSKQKVIGPQNIWLNWNITDADSASLSPAPGKVNAQSGSTRTRVSDTTTFVLRATNDCGTTQARQTVEVQSLATLLMALPALLLDDN